MERLRLVPPRPQSPPDELQAAMDRHPAGRALLPCPACDGHGRVRPVIHERIIAALSGRVLPANSTV